LNTCARFNYNVIALKSRTGVLESRMKCGLKFVCDLDAKVATVGSRLRGGLRDRRRTRSDHSLVGRA